MSHMVTEIIDQAIAREKGRLAAADSPSPRASHPLPTKADAWCAFCNAANDAEEQPDREAFELWWHGPR